MELAQLKEQLMERNVLERPAPPPAAPAIPETQAKVLHRPISVGPQHPMLVLASWTCPTCNAEHDREEFRQILTNPQTVLKCCGDHQVRVTVQWDWMGAFNA